MITFKSKADLDKLNRNNPAFPTVQGLGGRLIREEDYDPANEGYIVLIQEEDKDRVLEEIWDDWRLVDIPWEGVSKVDGFFWAIFLANNEFGIVFVIPNVDWVNGDLREVLEYHLDG